MSISLQFQLQRHLVVAVDHERAQDLEAAGTRSIDLNQNKVLSRSRGEGVRQIDIPPRVIVR